MIDSVEDDKNASWIYDSDGSRTRHQPDGDDASRAANTIEVTDDDQEAAAGLPGAAAALGAALSIRGDRSKTIREAFHDIQFTMAAHRWPW